MSEILDAIRKRIGPPVRRIPDKDRDYFFVRPPIRYAPNDDIMDYYREQEMLLREGAVGWGAIVYGDMHAFEPGAYDVDVIAIFSTDPTIEAEPERLWRMARQLYALREKKVGTDVEEQAYADLLNSTERGLGIKVPRSMSEGFKIRSTTLMVRRAHLPAGFMVGKYFPILCHPKCLTAMIVPSRAWPADYARLWQAELAGYPAIAVIDDMIRFNKELADFIAETKALEGKGDDWYVRIWVPEPTDGFDGPQHNIDFTQTYSPSRHVLSVSHGQRIVIDRSQIDLLAGLALEKANKTGVTA